MNEEVDGRLWRQAQAAYVDDPVKAVPDQQVRRSSQGLPWRGLSVWHQRAGPGDLYVPAAGMHCIIVRLGPGTPIMQRHGGQTRSGRWETGQVVVLPARMASFWRTALPRDNLHLDLAPHWLERARGGAGRPVALRSCFGAHDPLLAQLARVLLASLDDNSSLHAAFADGLAMSAAVHLLEHYRLDAPAGERAPALSRRQMQRLSDFVEARLDHRISLAELADQAGLSPYHFTRCVKAACGLTPHQWVVRRRMEVARERVLATRRSMLEIALEVGYASAAHFSHAFRRHWGVSPTALRRCA